MDALIAWLLTTFQFFATGLGILTIAGVTVMMLLFWEWRTLLVGLGIIQLGIAVLVTTVYQLNLEWARVQILVTLLSVAMLYLSARQIRFAILYQRPGAWFVRVMAIALLLVCWQLFDVDLALPTIAPPLTQIFIWLALCALIMLGLGDAPLFTGVALLLWFVPVQAFIQILLPEFRLFIWIGVIQLLTALACSYLMLTARAPALANVSTSTDLVIAPGARTPRALKTTAPPAPQAAPPLLPPEGQAARVPLVGEPPIAPRKAS